MSNLNGTPNELAEQIMGAVLTQVGATTALALVRQVNDLLQNSEKEHNWVEEGRQQLEEAAGYVLNSVGNLVKLGDDNYEGN
jgi:5-bromo-4-chloroindolyl phosphate hydrolysis protein